MAFPAPFRLALAKPYHALTGLRLWSGALIAIVDHGHRFFSEKKNSVASRPFKYPPHTPSLKLKYYKSMPTRFREAACVSRDSIKYTRSRNYLSNFNS
jgi:hypothetical protein